MPRTTAAHCNPYTPDDIDDDQDRHTEDCGIVTLTYPRDTAPAELRRIVEHVRSELDNEGTSHASLYVEPGEGWAVEAPHTCEKVIDAVQQTVAESAGLCPECLRYFTSDDDVCRYHDCAAGRGAL